MRNLNQNLDSRYLQELFRLEHLLWRTHEKIVAQRFLKWRSFLFEKKKQTLVGVVNTEKVYLQMTRVLVRLEQTVALMAPDWNRFCACQQNWSRRNNCSGSWRADQSNDGYEC